MTTTGFGGRIRQAVLDHASKLGRQYSFAEFGREVGQLDRGKPYTSGAVGEWLAERNEPSISTFRAMSAITGKPTEWLMALDTPQTARDARRDDDSALGPALKPPKDMPEHKVQELNRPATRRRSLRKRRRKGS